MVIAMDLTNSALLLIGYQNDYFSPDGVLHEVIEESVRIGGVVDNTVELLTHCGNKFDAIITTPIVFTPDYSELVNPTGILEAVKQAKAFQAGTWGAQAIDELKLFTHIIQEIPGKRGLNAFSNTTLHTRLKEQKIEHIYLAGAVTSVCIDSTGRAAFEYGYNVTVLSDCTSGRTKFEQDFYCQQVFPLYAEVVESSYVIKKHRRCMKKHEQQI